MNALDKYLDHLYEGAVSNMYHTYKLGSSVKNHKRAKVDSKKSDRETNNICQTHGVKSSQCKNALKSYKKKLKKQQQYKTKSQTHYYKLEGNLIEV